MPRPGFELASKELHRLSPDEATAAMVDSYFLIFGNALFSFQTSDLLILLYFEYSQLSVVT